MIIMSYNKETGETINYMKPAEGSTVFYVEEKPAEPSEPIVFRVEEKEQPEVEPIIFHVEEKTDEPVESAAGGLPKETIKALLQQAQANLDGGFVWDYINKNTNIKDLLKTIEGDPLVTVSIAAFFAGMKFALENLEIHE